MRSNGKRATKATASRKGSLKTASKTASAKRPARKAASRNGKRRQVVNSTVPPQFRELKQLAATNDPRFWELRTEFRDYFRSLPEEEVEQFLKGLGRPYLDYLTLALAQESWAENPVNIRGNS